MESVKPKRFSFAGFSSLSRSLSFSSGTTKKETVIQPNLDQPNDEDDRRLKRNLKTKSLYIKSFKKVSPPKTEYDPAEAAQTNGKEVRNSIRRSLSAVLYASPHSNEKDPNSTKKSNSSQLVPILVTAELSESVGGILIDEPTSIDEGKKKKKSKIVEYDNTLEIFDNEKDKSITVIWQGYGYSIDKGNQQAISDLDVTDAKDLELKFEKEIWEAYHGLIHPVHLFEETAREELDHKGRWADLTVQELKRYYDNYGSMMLKIRQAKMMKQQAQYHQNANKE